MELTASQVIFRARCGALPGTRDDKSCYLCGGATYAPQALRALIKPTFTDFDVARGDLNAGICCACAAALNEQDVDLQRLLGREKPQRPRNYSHFVKNGAWTPYSKAQKADMIGALWDAVPEVAIIAVSGQKHLAFKARVNPPGQAVGWLMFEEQHVWLDLDLFRATFQRVSALYAAHFNKESILTGRYSFYPDSDLATWKRCEPALRAIRGGAVLALAVYLCTRDDNEEIQEDE